MDCKEIFEVFELVKNKHEIFIQVTNHKTAPSKIVTLLLLFLDFKKI